MKAPAARGQRVAVELPYLPPACFSRNSRTHWRVRHKAQEDVSLDVAILLLEAGCVPETPWGRARVTVTWFVPTKRDYDADNLITRTKPVLDALVGTVILDDKTAVIGVPTYNEPVYRKGKPGTLIEVEKL